MAWALTLTRPGDWNNWLFSVYFMHPFIRYVLSVYLCNVCMRVCECDICVCICVSVSVKEIVSVSQHTCRGKYNF